MELTAIRAEIEHMRRKILRQSREIRDLQRAGIRTGLAEELLGRMQSKVDELCAECDRQLALLWHFRLGDICKEHVTVRTLSGWRSCEEVEDRLPDSRHAWLWRRS